MNSWNFILWEHEINVAYAIYSSVLITAIVFHIWMFYGFSRERRHLIKLAGLIPGPKPVPFLGNMHRFIGSSETLLQKMLDVTNEYPCPMHVWAGPTLLVILDDPRDIEIITMHPKSQHKGKLYDLLEPMVGKGLITGSGEHWRRHKKIIAPTFHTSILEQFVGTFVKHANTLVQNLKQKVDQPAFDVMKFVHACSVDTVCDTLMGTDMKIQSGDNSEFLHAIQRMYTIAFVRLFRVWLYSDWMFFNSPTGWEFKKIYKIYCEFSTKFIEKKKKEYYEWKKNNQQYNANGTTPEAGNLKRNRKVFLELLIELSQDSSIFSEEECREEIFTMFAAAVDTTATTSCFTFMMLGIHQDCQRKVYEELENIFGDSDRPATNSDLHKMKYLEQVLKESLRLFPIGPIILRQLHGDIKLRNYVLPSGCSVGLFLFRTQRNPDIFPDPLKFDPDRFSPENVASRHPYSFIPFSVGPRKCLGQTYAMMVLKTLTSTVLRKYKVIADMKMEDIKIKAEISIHSVGGYQIRLEHRH